MTNWKQKNEEKEISGSQYGIEWDDIFVYVTTSNSIYTAWNDRMNNELERMWKDAVVA
jgi:hypothetical protein